MRYTTTHSPPCVARVALQCVFHSLSNTPLDSAMFFGVHQRFWQQPNLIAFAFCGVGAAALAQHVSKRVTAAAHKATPPTWLAAATCGVVLALVAWQLRASHPKADMANDEYGDGVGQGGVLVMPSQLTVDLELLSLCAGTLSSMGTPCWRVCLKVLSLSRPMT